MTVAAAAQSAILSVVDNVRCELTVALPHVTCDRVDAIDFPTWRCGNLVRGDQSSAENGARDNRRRDDYGAGGAHFSGFVAVSRSVSWSSAPTINSGSRAIPSAMRRASSTVNTWELAPWGRSSPYT